MLTNAFDGCSTISDSDFQNVLSSCDFRDSKMVADLISKTYTPPKLNEQVAEVHFNKPDSAYNYFSNFYPTEVWDDGQGQDEFSELYYAPRIGYDFARFVKTMQICDPNAADECNTCYETLPDGGKGVLPPMEMYKWGIKTPPQCIANMRHIRDFRAWGQRLLRGWQSIDEQIMNMFFMFATIRLCGHKLVLQGVEDPNNVNQLIPYPNQDPKNPFQGFLYNYQQPLFPQVINADDIMPLEYQFLEVAARYWAHWQSDNNVGVGDRGQKVYEMWYPEDWYRDNVLQNPEYFDALKEYAPASTMAGYSLDTNGKREILGNWAIRQMPALPRFVESTEGGLIPTDNFVTEEVEIGDRPVPAGRDWLNAPFLMMIMPSPKAGKILYRPDLTTSVEGYPILPIMGRGGWTIRNDWDAVCNDDLNMPHSRRRYEIGFKLTDPDAAMSVIFRNKIFKIQPSNRCDWAPNTLKAPATHDCASNLTCSDNQRQADPQVTQLGDETYIECSCVACGDPKIWKLKFTREAYKKDYMPFDCVCGDTLRAVIADGTGTVIRTEDVTLIEQMPWPHALIWVKIGGADLTAEECIKGVQCYDADPFIAIIQDCFNPTQHPEKGLGVNDVEFLLDAPLDSTCTNVGDTVNIKSYDDVDGTGNEIAAATVGTIAEVRAGGSIIVVTLAAPNTDCEFQPLEVSKTVTC